MRTEAIHTTGDPSVARWLFLLLAGIYFLTAGGHTYSHDEQAMLATTISLVERRSVEIPITPENDDTVLAVEYGRTGEPVSFASFGQSIAGIPAYLAGSAWARLDPGRGPLIRRIFAGWTNSLVTAAGAVVLFFIARLLGAERSWAAALALVYGLGTFAWPHSKTFFSEPAATSLTLAAVLFAIGEKSTRKNSVLSGLASGLSILVRAHTGIFVLAIGSYLALRGSGDGKSGLERVGWFLLGASPALALVVVTNWWRFGSPTSFGYPTPDFAVSYFATGLHGLLLSPGKSIFLYAPVTLAGLAAVVPAMRKRPAEVGLLAGLGLVNLFLFALYSDWHGDHAWGPRYLIMSTPFFVLPLAPLGGRRNWRRALVATGIAGVLSAAPGVLIDFNGYFARVAEGLPTDFRQRTDDPNYWVYTHYDPYWSPLAGQARMIPAATANTIDVLTKPSLDHFPETTDEAFLWFSNAPPLIDFWFVWLRRAGGGIAMLLIPVFLAAALGGAVGLRSGQAGQWERTSKARRR